MDFKEVNNPKKFLQYFFQDVMITKAGKFGYPARLCKQQTKKLAIVIRYL